MVQFIRERKIIIWGSVFILLILSTLVLQPFLLSLTMGFTFAVALVPAKNFFISKFKWSQSIAATAVALMFAVFLMGPVVFVAYKFMAYINQNSRIVLGPNFLENRFFSLVFALLKRFGFQMNKESAYELFQQVAASTELFFLGIAKETFASLPDMVVQLVILFFTLFIALMNYKRFTFKTLNAVGVSDDVINRINTILFDVCKDVVFANILTGFIQASLIAVGIGLLTEMDAMMIFVVTFVFSFVPIIGAAPVGFLIAIFQFGEGAVGAAIALSFLSAVVGISDNIVRAKFMGRAEKDNTFIHFLASIGGIYLWGISGVFMGPLIVAFTMRTVPLLLEEIRPSNLEEV